MIARRALPVADQRNQRQRQHRCAGKPASSFGDAIAEPFGRGPDHRRKTRRQQHADEGERRDVEVVSLADFLIIAPISPVFRTGN